MRRPKLGIPISWYRRALKEIEGLMGAKRGTPKGDRLDVLVTHQRIIFLAACYLLQPTGS